MTKPFKTTCPPGVRHRSGRQYQPRSGLAVSPLLCFWQSLTYIESSSSAGTSDIEARLSSWNAFDLYFLPPWSEAVVSALRGTTTEPWFSRALHLPTRMPIYDDSDHQSWYSTQSIRGDPLDSGPSTTLKTLGLLLTPSLITYSQSVDAADRWRGCRPPETKPVKR